MNITFHGPTNFNCLSHNELFELRGLTNNPTFDKRDYDDRHVPVNSMFQVLIDNRLHYNEVFTNTFVIRAVLHRKVVGWTMYEFIYGETRAGFYVHHDHRRNGIGSKLLAKVKDESNNFFNGNGKLVVRPWNAAGAAFFAKNHVKLLNHQG